ncbi:MULTISPECIES: hypothetical protein [Alteromonadaceae]|uniref:Lipoprotein n=1 Tax=Brumicola blandensis TaxID=3075611 RepID=A0AAW8R8T9_9ALTE|nr:MULTISPECIES: hypothetical protein [unclassified Alteromonas]MDT0584350.1 hypothetical protein [Alteromonas sp. W409]MDT0630006.1 hypothetical protein [Alteromonas sp. W364]
MKKYLYVLILLSLISGCSALNTKQKASFYNEGLVEIINFSTSLQGRKIANEPSLTQSKLEVIFIFEPGNERNISASISIKPTGVENDILSFQRGWTANAVQLESNKVRAEFSSIFLAREDELSPNKSQEISVLIRKLTDLGWNVK